MESLEKLVNGLKYESNYQETENAALGFRSSFNPLVDMNLRVPSYRENEHQLIHDFMKGIGFDANYALKFLFFLRDVRGGLGERKSFRVLLKYMATTFHLAPSLEKNLHLVSEYGRWDDLFVLFDTPLESQMINLVGDQLTSDVKALRTKGSVSLLGKWMPSEQASSKQTKALSRRFREALKLTPRQYRKMLSALREEIGVVERQMTAKEWAEIDYSAVPSVANLRYNSAFLRNDEDRRRNFLERVLEGKETVNAGAVFPHDISRHAMPRRRTYYWMDGHVSTDVDLMSLEAQWRNLPDLMGGADESTIVVQDGSGSMLQLATKTATALDVAVSLAVYCAERLKGPLKNKAISFSERPTFLDYSEYILSMEKIQASYLYDEVANTDIEAVFDLILNAALRNQLAPNEMVKNVLIISDLEFDQQRTHSHIEEETLFEAIGKKFAMVGYPLPKLIFWNVASRTNTVPEYRSNTVLLGGFSPNALKIAFSGGGDPWESLKEVLDSPRYAAISA